MMLATLNLFALQDHRRYGIERHLGSLLRLGEKAARESERRGYNAPYIWIKSILFKYERCSEENNDILSRRQVLERMTDDACPNNQHSKISLD